MITYHCICDSVEVHSQCKARRHKPYNWLVGEIVGYVSTTGRKYVAQITGLPDDPWHKDNLPTVSLKVFTGGKLMKFDRVLPHALTSFLGHWAPLTKFQTGELEGDPELYLLNKGINPCPLEEMVAKALIGAKINFLRDSVETMWLDFYLPRQDLYIEVKGGHTSRISEQTSRAPNVIVLQGMESVNFFANTVSAYK